MANKKHLPILSFLLLILIISLFFLSPPSVKAIKARKLKAPPKPKGLLPEKDTFVDSAYPETNFGNENKLITAFTVSSKIIFLKFDVTNLPSFAPEDKVFLNLELEKSNLGLEPITLELLLPSNDWEENKLTWYNKPALYSSGLTATLEATPGAQKINLTPLVNQWLEGTTENTGIAFYYNLESFKRQYGSKENESHPPILSVEIKNPLPSPSPQTPQNLVLSSISKIADETKEKITEAKESTPAAAITSKNKTSQTQSKSKTLWLPFLIQLFYQNLMGITLWALIILVFCINKLLERKYPKLTSTP